MNALGHLEQLLLSGEISEDEYKERKAVYIEVILQLYIKGIINMEVMLERLNE